VDFGEVQQKYMNAGQGQVFDYADRLTATAASVFKKELESIDVEGLAPLTFMKPVGVAGMPAHRKPRNITKTFDCPETGVGSLDGLDVMKTTKAAVVLVACASGTRYGVSGSIGLVDIGLPSKTTLFALAAERVAKLSGYVGGPTIPLLVTVLETDLESTVAYFKANDYFGLESSRVEIFATKALPCVTEPDKKNFARIVLEDPGRVAMSDGSGNVVSAMSRGGLFAKLKAWEVKWVHFCPVENVLNLPCYPPLIAECEKSGVEACTVEPMGATDVDVISMVTSATYLESAAGKFSTEPALVRETTSVYGPKGRTIREAVRLEVPLSNVLANATSLLRFEVVASFFDAPIFRQGSKAQTREKALRALVTRSHTWLSAAGASVIGPEVEVTPLLSYCGEGLSEMSGQKLGMAEPSSLDALPRPVTRQGSNVALKDFRQYFKTPCYVETPR
jgi:hypothetical protein